MKKRGLTRVPRTLYRRGKAPKICITEAVNRQLARYEEMLMYQECLIEAFLHISDEETKKKVFSKLSSAQRKDLQRRAGKLT